MALAPGSWARQAAPHWHGHRAEAAEVLPAQSLSWYGGTSLDLTLFAAHWGSALQVLPACCRLVLQLAAQALCYTTYKGHPKHPASYPKLLLSVSNATDVIVCRCGILEDLLELLGGAEIEHPHVYREIAEGRILPGQHLRGLQPRGSSPAVPSLM